MKKNFVVSAIAALMSANVFSLSMEGSYPKTKIFG